jgi:hypothetical protein
VRAAADAWHARTLDRRSSVMAKTASRYLCIHINSKGHWALQNCRKGDGGEGLRGLPVGAPDSKPNASADQVVEGIGVAVVNGRGVQAVNWHFRGNWQLWNVVHQEARKGNFPRDGNIRVHRDSGG